MRHITTKYELVLRDESLSVAAITLWCDLSLGVAAIDAGVAPFIAAVSSLSDAIPVRQRIVYRVINEDATLPEITSDVRRSGVLIFTTADAEEYALIEIPSIRQTLILATGNGAGVLIDATSTEIQDIIAALIAAGVTNPFAVDISSLLTVYRQSRV